jgi:hypothetical protein
VLVRLPGAILIRDAEMMCERVWQEPEKRYGISRDKRKTWTVPRPTHFNDLTQGLHRSPAALSSPSVASGGELDQVAGRVALERLPGARFRFVPCSRQSVRHIRLYNWVRYMLLYIS